MGFIKQWLERLAEASKQSFGDQRLDCCDLQQKQKTSTPQDKKHSSKG